jgi:hypothetical protein
VIGQLHAPAALPRKRAPGAHWIGGWVDSRAGLEYLEKRKFLSLPRLVFRPLGRRARSQSLYRLSYPGSQLYCSFLRITKYPLEKMFYLKFWSSMLQVDTEISDGYATCTVRFGVCMFGKWYLWANIIQNWRQRQQVLRNSVSAYITERLCNPEVRNPKNRRRENLSTSIHYYSQPFY